MKNSSCFYLYGIFPAPGPETLELVGLDKQPVATHQVEGFTFLYSEAMQERYLASRRNLLQHERVLEEAMQAGYRTVLPLQFGLTVESWETIKSELVIPSKDRLAQLLQQLDGNREVSVKILWEMDTCEINDFNLMLFS